MKMNRTVVGIAAVLIAAALALFFAKPSSLPDFLRGKAGTVQKKTRPSSGTTSADPAASNAQSEAQDQTSEEAPTVDIPTDKQQMIGVETTTAAFRPLTKVIRTVGTVGYDEKKLATVNTKFEGWIEKLYVNFTGDYVKSGQPVAEIYSPELLATQQELLNLLKWGKGVIPPSSTLNKGGKAGMDVSLSEMLARDSESITEAARQRLRLWDITDAQIKKVEETGKPIRTLTVYSPVKGYVVQKAALQGMKVSPGEKLFDIADLSTVWIIADIYEEDLSLIRDGQTASIGLSYFPGREFTSRIDYVYPAVSGETRTAKVRFTINNPGDRLKPQMYTDVEIKVNLGKKLAVPKDAVIDTGTRKVVYVDMGEGSFEPREVMTGIISDDMVEITRGLKAGDKVASAANFLIDSEAKLEGVKPLPLRKTVKREK
jgi:membrane fusion protein, copper/silver efflux system